MQTQAQTATPTPRPAPPPPGERLAALARLDDRGLAERYREGRAPASLAALDGHPRGRMLAVRRLDGPMLGGALRRLAGAAFFPWGGKSFAGGGGINRVHLGGRHQLFPFVTSLAPSVLDGKPCVKLDYDLADNPGLIRKIHDEVREIEPGLFLGPAMWKRSDGPPVMILWFALDLHDPARPIGGLG